MALYGNLFHLVYLSAVSGHDVLYPRCILGHKSAGFYAFEGVPNKTRMQLSKLCSSHDDHGNFNPRAFVAK